MYTSLNKFLLTYKYIWNIFSAILGNNGVRLFFGIDYGYATFKYYTVENTYL